MSAAIDKTPALTPRFSAPWIWLFSPISGSEIRDTGNRYRIWLEAWLMYPVIRLIELHNVQPRCLKCECAAEVRYAFENTSL